jgi:hypothetical protein
VGRASARSRSRTASLHDLTAAQQLKALPARRHLAGRAAVTPNGVLPPHSGKARHPGLSPTLPGPLIGGQTSAPHSFWIHTRREPSARYQENPAVVRETAFGVAEKLP